MTAPCTVPALEVSDLCCRAGGTPILHGVSLQVFPGEFVGIIGPNGSGKSTLLKTIYKLMRPQSGSISLYGEDLLTLSCRTMAQKMAVVAQENSANFDFSVQEVVEMGRYPQKKLLESTGAQDKALVRTALEAVGLAGLAHRSFLTLSGGEKQRVLIARAFAQQTQLLVLDEPTNHLDVGSQVQTLQLLRTCGKTVLVALHDLGLAARYCDRVYVLSAGALAAQGSPADVITAELVERLYAVQAEVFDHRGHLCLDYL